MQITATTNVVEYFHKTSNYLNILDYLRTQSRLRSRHLRFDREGNLVHVMQVVVPGALSNKELTMQDLVDVIKQAFPYHPY
jgi:hypothetical protein